MQILRLILLKLKPLVSTLCMILLFGPSAAEGTITATLENPPDGEHMSGIRTISGWAYSDTGAPVSIRLRIDGELREAIPCCGERDDVRAVFPDAPLTTSFSLLFNYGRLSAGVHTIGIEVQAAGEAAVVLDHVVAVVKPGDVEFVETMDMTAATVRIEDNELLIADALVEHIPTDLRLKYAPSLQSPLIVEARPSGADGSQSAALAGGATTIFSAASQAFELPAPNLDGTRLDKHLAGDVAFGDSFVTAPAPVFSGLGPIFNNNACDRCHPKNGRGRPPREGEKPSSMFLRVSLPGTDPLTGGPLAVPGMGTQLQHRANFGVPPEGDVVISEAFSDGMFGDGEAFELRRLHFRIENPVQPIPDTVLTSPRTAIPVFGRGLLEAIDEDTILGFADEDDADGDGISGRPNRVWDVVRQQTALGRFGWKANNPTLLQQTFTAYNQDMGVTNPFLPQESAFGQVQDDGLADDPEIDLETVDVATFYVQTLAVPARRNLDDPQVQQGEDLFHEAQCTGCHIPTIRTGVLAGVPEVSNQTIHPYTDLLLHDMGDGLADGRPDFVATGREWRTPPLWGIGLTRRAQGHTFFLHDGRARNLTEAILWHGGEAEAAREAFRLMPLGEREALLTFLESL